MQQLNLFFLALLISMQLSAAVPLERSDEDAKRDLTSKPFDVLKFIDIQPGWQVIDLFAGNGYYTELLAHAVGSEGKVYLHNNQAYMAVARKLNDRVKDQRLPNVEVYVREVEDINIKSDSLDLVMMVMAYHDVYFEQSGWTVTADPLFKTIKRILKPGGQLLIIDHDGNPGTGNSRVQDLHRIEATFAKTDISNRGFSFEEESTVLLNEQDQLNVSVFDPQVSGRSSRFIYKFRKR